MNLKAFQKVFFSILKIKHKFIDFLLFYSFSIGSEIRFQVGGEVHHAVGCCSLPFRSSGPISIDSCSTMTNSTIICMEANKVAIELQNYSPTDSLNSLDLEHIRPPSVMDCVSLSTVTYEIPATHSPQMSRSRKKSLPTGIMARRALGQLGIRGSVESINSIGCSNLDNIKPPSIMDELMDSMISVASITSEVADNNTLHNNIEGASIYETAMSEMDDTTLQSCMDLPNDITPIPSDFSSNESTPKKGELKRTLTPKQKRQMSKDRFKTYTIAALNEVQKQEDDEVIQVEIRSSSPRRLTPREKRKEDRSRFETQVLNMSEFNLSVSSNGSEASPSKKRLEDPDRFKTRTINYQETEQSISTVLKEANVVIQKLNQTKRMSEEFLLDEAASDCISLVSNDDCTEDLSIKAVTAHLKYIRDLPKTMKIPSQHRHIDDGSDLTSLEYEQNSETESCDQNRYYDSDEPRVSRPRIVKQTNDLYLDSAGDEGGSSPEPKGIRGRKRSSYISPYKRTSVNATRTISPVAHIRTNLATRQDFSKKNSVKSFSGRTQSLISKTNLTNKINSIKSGFSKPALLKGKSSDTPVTSKATMSKSKTFTEISSHCVQLGTSPQITERQGTFIKEEGTDLDVPVVTSAPATPCKTSKLPTKIQSPKKCSSAGSSKGLASKLKIPLFRSGSHDSSANTTRISGVEINKKRNSLGVAKSTSVSNVPIGQRSNSITFSRSNTGTNKKEIGLTPARSTSSVITPPKKDITSKIAGIWKKIDESKKQQAAKKDTRVWIGSKSKPATTVVSAKPPVPPTYQLIRSSTFDATPENGQHEKGLPVIRARTLKSPSSGNLKGIANGSVSIEKRGVFSAGLKRS